ncbi:hypothetical protein ES702_02330 [subsurface metagenome]
MATSLFAFACFLVATAKYTNPLIGWHGASSSDHDIYIPLGKSVDRGGREVFWWEQFPRLIGFYRGRNDVVPSSAYIPEQQQSGPPFQPLPSEPVSLKPAYQRRPDGVIMCSFVPPTISAYDGLPQGMSSALLGSMQEMGINDKVCYDRIARYGRYGFTASSADGGFGLVMRGDTGTTEIFDTQEFHNVTWGTIQDECVQKNQATLTHRPRTAFILRTWHTFDYTPHHILMLRAMINELSLRSGGQIYVHFLIHVQDDSLPIFASKKAYDRVLKSSLPEEFEGMGTLWSVPQMKLVYPPPFPESIINFSGGDVYEAYRSLHFPTQYFASQHPEFDYFWQWEMDIRVTGHYGELIEKIAEWADKQSRDHLWERSEKFFIPSLHESSFTSFTKSIIEETKASKIPPVSGPMLPTEQLLPIPNQPAPSKDQDVTDLITLSPLFNPERTQWAFHDDITGYPDLERPPTRAALIAASRMSRRLLLLMHQETYAHKHTMFPEMYPASIALHYGLKAVYAPITTYFDRDWSPKHADEIFNNGKLRPESFTAGMDNGGGHFHAEGGSVFGPGEHVFRGASWYSNAGFAGYLWRRWLGEEKDNGEIDWELGEGRGRMCLPMMVLHPVKNDAW